MNVDRIQDAAASLRAVRAPHPRPQKLDLTSAEPAVPAATADVSRVRTGTVASIKGVLSAEEERAIADMFAPQRGGYDRAGAATRPTAVPGGRLNLQA